MDEVRKDLIAATAAISAISSFLMGLLANLPVGMAPGLGLNAYVCIKYFLFTTVSKCPEVHLLDRWLPWNRRHHVPRSTCGCFHGRVCYAVAKAGDYVPERLG